MAKRTSQYHTAEPWREKAMAGGWDGVGTDTVDICILRLNNPANARRIVAAVNACANIPTEALEAGAIGKLVEALKFTADYIEQLPCGIDYEAAIDDPSPEDAASHIGGLVWQRVGDALAALKAKPPSEITGVWIDEASDA